MSRTWGVVPRITGEMGDRGEGRSHHPIEAGRRTSKGRGWWQTPGHGLLLPELLRSPVTSVTNIDATIRRHIACGIATRTPDVPEKELAITVTLAPPYGDQFALAVHCVEISLLVHRDAAGGGQRRVMLPAQEQDVLRKLLVFRGAFFREAAKDV
jgi:hypothetical protein